ncbi:uncharacterized protein LOC135131548 [Zophobas morio]|uniref:uncharacterized protein LOC135131548 n=1 Tax=Zophobas morio TaxID=2755281 RepID=UPI003083330A
MKEKQYRTKLSPNTNPNMREADAVQHCYPHQIREKANGFSSNTYTSELPSGKNFNHLHPVYKYVDSFLSNPAINKRPTSVVCSSCMNNREFSHGRYCKKNSIRYIGSDYAPRTCVDPSGRSYRANYQIMGNNKQNNIQNNLHSRNTQYCAIRTPSPCFHRRQNNLSYTIKVKLDSPSTNPPCTPTPVESNYYVDGLKNEIKQSKAQICQLITKPSAKSVETLTRDLARPVDDQYVRKLKEELICRKTKCINEAKNIISELQNEITGFRLKTKTKVSSSCSDIGAGDQPPPTSNICLDAPKIVECRSGSKKNIGEKRVLLSCSPRGEPPRWTECKTLWQAQGVSKETTENCASQNINFEAKLEEAHSLIEKVRATLRDIGKGIPKSSEQNNMPSIEQINANDQSLRTTCSFPGECLLKNAISNSLSEERQALKSQDKEKKEDESLQRGSKKDVRAQDGTVKEKHLRNESSTKEKVIKKVDSLQKDGTNEKEIKKDDKIQQKGKKKMGTKRDKSPRKISTMTKKTDKNKEKKLLEEKRELCKNNRHITVKEEIELEAKPEKADLTNESNSTPTDKKSETLIPLATEAEENDPKQIITIQSVKPMLSDDDFTNKSDGVSQSMDLLQEKLKVISEEDTAVPVSRMERGSSPINFLGDANSQPDQSFKVRIHKNDLECILPSVVEHNSQSANNEVFKDLKANHVDTDGEIPKLTENNLTKAANKTYPSGSTSASLHDTITSNTGSFERISEKSSEKWTKATRLSIQKMPPVNIRGGLVMQKTLHLCIKPSGSVTNDVGKNRANIGYKEITMVSNTSLASGRCPDDCKNIEGGYCKSNIYKAKSVFKDIGSVEKLDRRTIAALDEDTYKLYKSFQIFDGKYESGRNETLDTLTTTRKPDQINPMESKDTVMKMSSVFKQNRSSVRPYSPSVSDSLVITKANKNPWAIGFYKSKATQCNDLNNSIRSPRKLPVSEKSYKTALPVQDIPPKPQQKLHKHILVELDTESDVPTDMPADVPTLEKSNVSTLASEDVKPDCHFEEQEISTHSLETSSVDMATSQSATRPESTRTNTTEQDSSLEENANDTSSSHRNVNENVENKVSEESAPKFQTISVGDILTALQDYPNDEMLSSSKDYVSDGFQIKEKTESVLDKPLVPELPINKKKDEKKEKTVKSAHDFSSSSSSSGSSYYIHGSLTSPQRKAASMTPPAATSATNQPAPSISSAKRPQDPSDEKIDKKSSLKNSEFINSLKIAPDEVKNEDFNRDNNKRKGPKKSDKVEVEHEVSKEVKPPIPLGQKVDESIQVSLESLESDSSTDSSFEEERERANTIAYFIKGLTGTSQEQLEKLRSNPSFPKTDLQTYSKSALKLSVPDVRSSYIKMSETSKTKKDDEKRMPSADTEEEVETLDYVKPSIAIVSSDDDLSDKTKLQRLKQFQKMQGSVQHGGDKNEKTVMRVTAEKNNSIEGEHSHMLSKRHLPFYRRVLGRIIEPNSKRPMPKSLSDAHPVEESISEGEIKCRNSQSIGEVGSYKYIDRKKIGKAGVKYLKKHLDEVNRKETGDQSVRIARQRAQYNNWVTYYLQKQHNVSLNDDSSFSSSVNKAGK